MEATCLWRLSVHPGDRTPRSKKEQLDLPFDLILQWKATHSWKISERKSMKVILRLWQQQGNWKWKIISTTTNHKQHEYIIHKGMKRVLLTIHIRLSCSNLGCNVEVQLHWKSLKLVWCRATIWNLHDKTQKKKSSKSIFKKVFPGFTSWWRHMFKSCRSGFRLWGSYSCPQISIRSLAFR